MTTLFLQITFLIANLFFVGISYDIASSKQFDINNISLEAELSTELGE